MNELDLQRLRELALLLTNGTPEEQLQADVEIGQLKKSLGQEDVSRLDNYISDVVAESIKATPRGKLTNEQESLIRATVATNVGLGAIKLGAGLAQIIDAAARDKGIKAPEMPATMGKNAQLQSRISESMVREEQGDPMLRQYFRERLAGQNRVDEARARSAGSTGQYLANSQANQLRSNETLRNFYVQEDQNKRQDLARTDNLVGQSINEDFRILDDYWRRFNVDEQRYRASQAALAAQRTSGFNNAFTGLNELATVPGLLQYIRKTTNIPDQQPQMQTAQMPTVEMPRQELPPIQRTGVASLEPLRERSMSSAMRGVENPYQPNVSMEFPGMQQMTPLPSKQFTPMSTGKMAMLGNPAYRNPQDVENFQDMARYMGIPVSDRRGEWGDLTQSAYDRLTQMDLMRLSR